jgi:hypothetical protein
MCNQTSRGTVQRTGMYSMFLVHLENYTGFEFKWTISGFERVGFNFFCHFLAIIFGLTAVEKSRRYGSWPSICDRTSSIQYRNINHQMISCQFLIGRFRCVTVSRSNCTKSLSMIFAQTYTFHIFLP